MPRTPAHEHAERAAQHARKRAEQARARSTKARDRIERRDPFIGAQLVVGAAILLYLALPAKLTIGPAWLIPTLEGLLLAGLVIATPHPAVKYSPVRRELAMSLVGIVSAVNLVSLVLLVHYLLQGGKAGGHQLILAGVVLWCTNVLLFALWYWLLDGGGPVLRALDDALLPDFLFPQMDKKEYAPPGWMPTLLDYLYVSLTNAAAFSPTDTMPLTPWAKVLMSVQSMASLVTVGLVVARAVNILT